MTQHLTLVVPVPAFPSLEAAQQACGALVVFGTTSGDVHEIRIRELYESRQRIVCAPLGDVRELGRVMDLVFAGEVATVIDHTFQLDAIEDAMVRLADQAHFGMIVLQG